MTTSSKIIGVAGKDRSGKDSVAELLMQYGYFGFSFGDAVREHARQRHADKPDPVSVKNMTETSNWLRQTHGPDVILKEALAAFDKAQQIGEYKGVVLFSVRAPIEADFILEHGGQLVWIEASDQVRLERRLANLRPGEAKVTMDDMLAQEALQVKPQPGIPEEVQMNLDYIKSKATITIKNDGSDFEGFKQEVSKALELA